ncbi:MAG: hypothetical protein NTX71_04825 [Candidatus Aureabacteria bacterium]|nr:hypothetical protein [Candidatus Auribacterota bacterium]
MISENSVASIIHFRYARIESSQSSISLDWKGIPFKLCMLQKNKLPATSIKIVYQEDTKIKDLWLFYWLSVYFGERFFVSSNDHDTRWNGTRGVFPLDNANLIQFLHKCERTPFNSYPLWKKELFELSLLHYMVALKLGVNFFPLTMVSFATSIEILQSMYINKRNQDCSLGTGGINRLIHKRLNPAARPNFAASTRDAKNQVIKELELLRRLRNIVGAHSFIHIQKDRIDLIRLLRQWYIRDGFSKQFANGSFRSSRLLADLHMEAFALYKLGLRLNRLLFFYYLGYKISIPFASHDWRISGNSPIFKAFQNLSTSNQNGAVVGDDPMGEETVRQSKDRQR